MKIAMVGGGFYGCYISTELKRVFGTSVQIDLFERDKAPMLGAALNNQARLHMGFHYPRSVETLTESWKGYQRFVSRFSEFLRFPRQNLYVIERGGHLSLSQYLNIFNCWGIPYREYQDSLSPYFVDPGQIEGGILVDEAVVDLVGLRSHLLSKLNCQMRMGTSVKNIDSFKGYLDIGSSWLGPYDWIFNCTYLNPNLGLSPKSHFEIKRELTTMLLVPHPFGKEVGLTVMDGNFASLYPWNEDLSCLSSVLYTPSVCFFDGISKSDIDGEDSPTAEAILSHGRNMFRLPHSLKPKRMLVSGKCKLKYDFGDLRTGALRIEERLISVFCGKLGTALLLADDIIQIILGGHTTPFLRAAKTSQGKHQTSKDSRAI